MKQKKRVIDREEALTLMEKAVIDRGEDWRYPAAMMSGVCMYFADAEVDAEVTHTYGIASNGPACLVGLALSYVGLTKEIVDYRNDQGVITLRALAVESDDLDWELSSGAISVFSAAQYLQDQGARWGDALDSARGAS